MIRQGIDVPEGHNDLRRMQLRELAQLNGTLRETDCPRCTNCGSTEHKSWLCPDKPNITNNIVCSACGGAGHISKDCRSKRPGAGGPPASNAQAKIDEEYMSLMAELGEGPVPEKPSTPSFTPSQSGRFGVFEQRPAAQPRAIMAPPPMPPWGSQGPPPMGMPPMMPPPGPPGTQMPPVPGGPPPPMPWMSNNHQPPPPGSNDAMNGMPPPPGTTPPHMQIPQQWQMAQQMAPQPPQPMMPPPFPWGNAPPQFIPSAAPPPPPGAPPPVHSLLAPPPPPPPS